MSLPPPGTFRLYAFAEPPLPAGSYILTGDVSGLPGPVEQLPTSLEIVSPRYALPPDQILGTFPPAGARGAFTSRLPQIVLKRRTLPWERSSDLAPGGTPTPWLALVLLAEGEGELHADAPVEQCVTPGVALGPDRDVPKSSYVEVPKRVVDAVFPTREDLSMLAHVREVDMRDTELAMGDDDGWMAVVLCNRLPQPNTRYLACLINLEGQYDELPTVPDVDLKLEYNRFAATVDLRAIASEALGSGASVDTALMGLGGTSVSGAAAPGLAAAAAQAPSSTSTRGPSIRSASGAKAPTGAGWAATAGATAEGIAASAGATRAADKSTLQSAKLALADGFSFPAGLLLERTLRFPVLAYWSFTCEERGDFQYLAEHITARLLGYVPEPGTVETPDGDPLPAGDPPPPAARPEPSSNRPLPLVAETGHVALETVTRRGDPAEAWFRGPLAPTPVERAETRPDGADRPPLAHHADQLRRVVPDGREDLGYAAAFEIGRLLALSQPGIVAALGRWRQEAFGSARARSATADAISTAPPNVRDLANQADPLTSDSPDRLLAGGAGRRATRALFQVLGENPAAIATSRPLADPGDPGDDLRRATGERRDTVLTVGLGIDQSLANVDTKDAPTVAAALASTPATVIGQRDISADVAALRAALEAEAGRVADAALGADKLGNSNLDLTGGRS